MTKNSDLNDKGTWIEGVLPEATDEIDNWIESLPEEPNTGKYSSAASARPENLTKGMKKFGNKKHGSRKGSSKDRHPDFRYQVTDTVRRTQGHVFLGYEPGTIVMVKDDPKDENEVALPRGVKVHQFVGWDIGKKYNGSKLRQLRKERGVGRHRKPESEQTI